MAVYTKLNATQITSILRHFPRLSDSRFKFQGIKAGTVNTIYKIMLVNQRTYYLKIDEVGDEKRLINEISILKSLCRQKKKLKFDIPCPVSTRSPNKCYIPFNHKFALLAPEVKGQPIYRGLRLSHIASIGARMAELHQIRVSQNIHPHRYCLQGVIAGFHKIRMPLKKKHPDLYRSLRKRLDRLQTNEPKQSRPCIIHADIFPENIFWYKNRFTGMIDFESAGLGDPLFDICVCIHAFCFKNNQFDVERIAALLKGYQSTRKISKKEFEHFDYFLELTATRFLVTRLTGFELPSADPKAENFKDYREYKNILEVLPRLKITPTAIFS